MLRVLALTLALAALVAGPGRAFTFVSIDGGTLDLDDWRGQPVLVVNTASMCAFTDQYEGLQALYDRYRDRGLVVLAVPSDDFRQELGSAEEVKEFCEINYGIDMPMTDITSVRGDGAHDFYRWVAETEGFAPRWNFGKILLAPDGSVAATFGTTARPTSGQITGAVEALLGG